MIEGSGQNFKFLQFCSMKPRFRNVPPCSSNRKQNGHLEATRISHGEGGHSTQSVRVSQSLLSDGEARGTPGPQSGQKRRPLLSLLKRQDAPLFQVLHIIQVASKQHYRSVPTTTCSLPHHLSAPKLLPRSDWSPGKANAGDHPPPPARARPPRGALHPSRLCPSRLLRPATLQSKRT